MPTISFGPLTGNASGPLGGSGNTVLIFDTGQTGEALVSVDMTCDAAVVGYTGSAWAITVAWKDVADADLAPSTSGTLHFNSDPSYHLVASAPSGATRAQVIFSAALNSPDTATGTVNGSIEATVYCQYGTRLQPGQRKVEVITEAAIGLAAVAVPELAFLAVAWGAIIGWTWIPDTVCAGPPPAVPVFTDADFLFANVPSPGSLPKFYQAFLAAAWPLYCECSPATGGGSAPITFPPPVVTAPTNAPPVVLPATCDNGDICLTLDAIIRQLTAMAAQIGYIRSDVQLIQRQAVPFGYVAGAVHAGLSGAGELAVQGLIGCAVDFTTIPPHLGLVAGNPDAHLWLGWLNLGTSDGWLKSLHLVDDPTLELPIGGEITRIGYSLEAGVIATITELVRES